MKLRFLFHNGQGPNIKKGFWKWAKARAISGGIKAHTYFLALVRGDWKSLKHHYGHVEAQWPDLAGDFETVDYGGHFERIACGYCFSSTTRGKYKGVRIAPAAEVLHNPHRWSYIDIDVTQAQLDAFKAYAESRVGRKYDYWGIFGFFLPWNTQKKADDYCSEVVVMGLVAAGIIDIAVLGRWKFRISPRRTAKVLAGIFHEPKQL